MLRWKIAEGIRPTAKLHGPLCQRASDHDLWYRIRGRAEALEVVFIRRTREGGHSGGDWELSHFCQETNKRAKCETVDVLEEYHAMKQWSNTLETCWHISIRTIDHLLLLCCMLTSLLNSQERLGRLERLERSEKKIDVLGTTNTTNTTTTVPHYSNMPNQHCLWRLGLRTISFCFFVFFCFFLVVPAVE